jgi:hypothetical protein
VRLLPSPERGGFNFTANGSGRDLSSPERGGFKFICLYHGLPILSRFGLVYESGVRSVFGTVRKVLLDGNM